MTAIQTGYAAAALDELPTLWDGAAQLVRAGLGITAFGANILNLPPGHTTPSHDEAESGQQELYLALDGAGWLGIDGGEGLLLDRRHAVRVDAGTSRHLRAGPDGLRVLCIGGVPGAPYDPPGWSAA